MAALVAFLCACQSPARDNQLRPGATYHGLCDASAAVAIDDKRFLVASDEDNVIRLYSLEGGDKPLARFDLSEFIKPEESRPESDLEAAAELNGKIFWITSHGRNKDNKLRESRHRLFATEVVRKGSNVELRGVGAPYSRLLDDMFADPRLKKYRLEAASLLAPKTMGGLNIEGLAATPDGKLLVGFRNPVPEKHALIVPIENPMEVIDGKRAKLGAPRELDLGGLGIRDMVYVSQNDPKKEVYLIVAGSYQSGGKFHLYHWDRKSNNAPRPIDKIDFDKLNPEVVFVFPSAPRRIQFLSDDGTKVVDGRECKRLADEDQRTFRSAFWQDEAKREKKAPAHK